MTTGGKFVDNNILFESVGVLDNVFDDLKKCLESEGVNLTSSDIVKAFDLYLRTSGISPYVDDSEPINAIYTWSNILTFKNLFDDDKAAVQFKEIIVSYMNHINDNIDDTRKIKDMDTVVSNVEILFKEFTILANEIISYIEDIFFKSSHYKVILAKRDGENIIKISGNLIVSEGDSVFVIEYMSNVISNTSPRNITVIGDSFEQTDLDLINRLIAGKPTKDGNK